MYIEKESFETPDVVEVAMNNDNNQFRDKITILEKKGNILLQKAQVLCEISMKTNDDLKIGNFILKLFTEN